jgi:protein involved in polysaccharide export with SLBB domain
MLPTFGADLFQDVPSTFAPVDRIPVTPDYLVGPGDQLVIRGWGQIDLRVSPVVDRTGAIYIPQIGELNVTKLRFSQLQEYLKSAIGRVYRNFDLSVGMGQLRSVQVFVMGHARRPGAYTVSSLSTLVNAVFASGGLDFGGSMREIRLRPSTRITTFDRMTCSSTVTSRDKVLRPATS